MDNRLKILVIVILVAGATLMSILIYLVTSGKPAPRPVIEPSATPSPSLTSAPTPRASAIPNVVYEESVEVAISQDPVVAQVPKVTPYWTVEITKDPENGKLPLTVTVYVWPDQKEDEVVTKQRPYIESWLTSIGQRSGTYTLEFKSERPHTY